MTSQDTGNAAGAGGMMTTMDCLPCFIRQALEAARLATHAGLPVGTHVLKLFDPAR